MSCISLTLKTPPFHQTPILSLLLVVVPNFGSALECYTGENETAAGHPLRALAQWKVKKLMNFTTSLGIGMRHHLLNDGQETEQCKDYGVGYSNYCYTLHCAKIFGDETIKGCAFMADGFTPAHVCEDTRNKCGDDPKFYYRLCNTDKCNNE